jgi:hypothetical protein
MTVLVKVIAGGRERWTAHLMLDDTGTCIHAEPHLVRCLGHAKAALGTYFAEQGWTATILVPKAIAPPPPLDAPAAPAGISPAVMADPVVQAILAEFPGAIVRPLLSGVE